MYKIFQSRFCSEHNIRPQNCQRRRVRAEGRHWAGLQIFLVSEEAGDKLRAQPPAHQVGTTALSSAGETGQRHLKRAATSFEALAHRNSQCN